MIKQPQKTCCVKKKSIDVCRFTANRREGTKMIKITQTRAHERTKNRFMVFTRLLRVLTLYIIRLVSLYDGPVARYKGRSGGSRWVRNNELVFANRALCGV